MWIEEIYVEHFGALNRVALADLKSGVTVISGPNEAGKSTLLELIRSVFFGFRKKGSAPNAYDPPEGMLRSGWLTVFSQDNGRVRMHRQERRGNREGVLTLTDEGGYMLTPDAIGLSQPGVDRAACEAVWAFDLEGLRRLDHEALRARIVAASLGSVAVNPLDVSKTLEDLLKALTGRGSSERPSLPFLQDRMREITRMLSLASEQARRHERIKDEIGRVLSERELLKQTLQEQECSLKGLEKLIRCEDAWHRLVVVDEELSALEAARNFPADGMLRLGKDLAGRDGAAAEVRRLEEIIEDCRAGLHELEAEEGIIAHADTIAHLARDAGALAECRAETGELKVRVGRVEQGLSAELSLLGPGWDLESVEALDTSRSTETEIERHDETLRQLGERVHGLSQRASEAEGRCGRIRSLVQERQENLDRLTSLCREHPSPERSRRVQEWLTYSGTEAELTQRLVEQGRQIKRLAGEQTEVQGRLKREELEPRKLIPGRFVGAVVGCLSAASAVMIWAASKSAGAGETLFLGIGGLLLLMIPAFLASRRRLENRSRRGEGTGRRALLHEEDRIAGQIAEIDKERRNLAQRLQTVRRCMEDIGFELFGSRRASEEQFIAEERRSRAALEAERRRSTVTNALNVTMADLATEEKRFRQIAALLTRAEQELAFQRCQWEEWSAQRGFSKVSTPSDVANVLRRARELKGIARDLRERKTRLHTLEAQWEGFRSRVDSLAWTVDRSAVDLDLLDPIERVEGWQRRGQKEKERQQERQSLTERLEEHEYRHGLARARCAEFEQQIDSLFDTAGIQDEESFRLRSQSHERCHVLEQERDLLLHSLETGAALHDRDEVYKVFSRQDWEANRSQCSALLEDLDFLRARIVDLAGRSGSLSQEIESLEAQDRSEALLAEQAMVLGEVHSAVQEWLTLRLGALLLARTIRLYEADKQPRVLKKAGEILARLTGGASTRVVFPLDDERIKVERSDGTRVDEVHLSRGTLEQLYLAFRLAHLELQQSGDRMPLAVDDVLVNFDRERARRCAEVLVEEARATGTQVLFFTCHEHIADLFPDCVARRHLPAEQLPDGQPPARGGPAWASLGL